MIVIKTVSFESILPIWKHELWPHRTTEIKSMSSMTFMQGHDMSIYDTYNPTWWAAYANGELVGVNSGHGTTSTSYRSRGLWVSPECRGRGIAKMLLRALDKQAIEEGMKVVWTMPRRGSEHAYLSTGYALVGDWIETDTGVNIYAVKTLIST